MPESGVPPELIEEDDVCDYAFVGDISEVIRLLHFTQIKSFLTLQPDHYNRKRQRLSQPIYNCVWNHNRFRFNQSNFHLNILSIHQSPSCRFRLSYLLLLRFRIQKMEKQKTDAHFWLHNIRLRYIDKNQTRQ